MDIKEQMCKALGHRDDTPCQATSDELLIQGADALKGAAQEIANLKAAMEPPTNESPHLAAKYWRERQSAINERDEALAALARVRKGCAEMRFWGAEGRHAATFIEHALEPTS